MLPSLCWELTESQRSLPLGMAAAAVGLAEPGQASVLGDAGEGHYRVVRQLLRWGLGGRGRGRGHSTLPAGVKLDNYL